MLDALAAGFECEGVRFALVGHPIADAGETHARWVASVPTVTALGQTIDAKLDFSLHDVLLPYEQHARAAINTIRTAPRKSGRVVGASSTSRFSQTNAAAQIVGTSRSHCEPESPLIPAAIGTSTIAQTRPKTYPRNPSARRIVARQS